MREERSDLLVILGTRGIAYLLGETFHPFRSNAVSSVEELSTELLESSRAFPTRGIFHRLHHRRNLYLKVFEKVFEPVDITTETVEGAASIENFHDYQIGFGR